VPKKKRSKHGFDIFDVVEEDFLLNKNFHSAANSGYSISVTYGSDGKPLVRVQTQGNVDKAALRSELKKKYPNAKIEGLTEKPLIKEISTKSLKPEGKPVKKKKSN
jgi:ribosomal protein L25 (general stress protein Ctc)